MSSNITQLDIHQINKRAQGSKQTWEELDNIYNGVMEGLLIMAAKVNEVVAAVKDHPNTNKSLLSVTVRGMADDIERYMSDLVTIHQKHESKQGVITNEDDLALCLSLFNDYYTVNQYIHSTMLDPMITITEIASEAQDVL